jgi:hypothetical protein
VAIDGGKRVALFANSHWTDDDKCKNAVIPCMTTTAWVKCEKSARGHQRWKRSQGRRVLAFILTLDGVSSAPIIELGWKRSVFAFQRSFQPWRNGVLLLLFVFRS